MVFKDSTVTGQYYLDDNIVSVLPLKDRRLWNHFIGISTEEYISNLYHELLHMSSTILDKEKNIAFSGFSQIEEIITKEKMTNLYFNANLYELTRELQKYNTKENIEKFFEDLD